jgi:phenylalanyl-tRNA synthetase alpha chain
MDDKELISRLHEHEKKILEALQKKKMRMSELKKEIDLPEDSIEKASLWAKVKGVIKIDEKIMEFCELTKEGQQYYEEDLPEKNLLKAVAGGESEIGELKKKVDKFNIGLVWVKKNGWVEIRDGKLLITEKGKDVLKRKLPEEDVLSELSSGPKMAERFDKKMVENLEKRKIIAIIEKKERNLYLTDLGKKIVPKIEIKDEIGQLTPKIIMNKGWKGKALRSYDIKLPTEKIYPGRKHFMTQVIEYVRKIWLEMGFKEMTGSTVDVSFWNFDALYQPQDHPARDLADTFYMKNPETGKLPKDELVKAVKSTHENGWTCNSTGWQYKWDAEFAKKIILRTHTTNLSAYTLSTLTEDDLPAKFFSVGRCFRNETLDATHLAEFYQTDGIVVGEDVNFRHLLGYLKRYFSKLGFPKARFRPAYFPYTEMSTEIEVWHPALKKWLELGGAGIFRPEVVKPLLGKDIPVLAWGPGFGRLVMINYDIKDIRELYMNDLGKLKKIKLWLG